MNPQWQSGRSGDRSRREAGLAVPMDRAENGADAVSVALLEGGIRAFGAD